eukprot:365586-Chlamydomonas_euryale.AAC.5
MMQGQSQQTLKALRWCKNPDSTGQLNQVATTHACRTGVWNRREAPCELLADARMGIGSILLLWPLTRPP